LKQRAILNSLRGDEKRRRVQQRPGGAARLFSRVRMASDTIVSVAPGWRQKPLVLATFQPTLPATLAVQSVADMQK